jgi:hypothetical protein
MQITMLIVDSTGVHTFHNVASDKELLLLGKIIFKTIPPSNTTALALLESMVQNTMCLAHVMGIKTADIESKNYGSCTLSISYNDAATLL